MPEYARNRMVAAVREVLAPNGLPIFEWGHETTPTDSEVQRLAEDLVDSIYAAGLMDLFGVAEAAECLGIAIQNLSGKNKPTGLPDPIAHPRATRVWLAEDIRAFALEVGARRQARTSKEAV